MGVSVMGSLPQGPQRQQDQERGCGWFGEFWPGRVCYVS
jgi:hypothetical protein